MIYDFQYKVLTPKELEDIKANAKLMTQLARRCRNKCGNPHCQLPLSDDNFRVLKFGDVCALCYTLYKIMSESAYWNRVQLEEERDDSDYGPKKF